MVGDESWTNYAVEVDVLTNDWNFPVRIIVRAQGRFHMVLQTNCCGTSWILVTNGEERVIAMSGKRGLTGGVVWHTDRLRIEVQGDIYTVYRDEEILLRVQDNTLSNGRVGLALDHTKRFDNFQVTELP